MFFEASLRHKVGEYGPLWPTPPLCYCQLKALISPPEEAVGNGETKNEFFALLRQELERVNQFSRSNAAVALREHWHREGARDEMSLTSTFFHNLLCLTGCWRCAADAGQSVLSHARVCNEYAKINGEGFQKILKKYDKVRQSEEGRALWLSLWRDQSPAVAFLHSPLRLRIDAIESAQAMGALQTDRIVDAASPFEPRCCLCKGDVTCPICLGVLYEPVALSCGHVYCLSCLLKNCSLGKAVGTVRALMSNIDPDKPCCKCRQHGVYKNAALLPELDAYVHQTFPEEWEIRNQDEKEAAAEKVRLLREKKRKQAETLKRFHPALLLQ